MNDDADTNPNGHSEPADACRPDGDAEGGAQQQEEQQEPEERGGTPPEGSNEQPIDLFEWNYRGHEEGRHGRQYAIPYTKVFSDVVLGTTTLILHEQGFAVLLLDNGTIEAHEDHTVYVVATLESPPTTVEATPSERASTFLDSTMRPPPPPPRTISSPPRQATPTEQGPTRRIRKTPSAMASRTTSTPLSRPLRPHDEGDEIRSRRKAAKVAEQEQSNLRQRLDSIKNLPDPTPMEPEGEDLPVNADLKPPNTETRLVVHGLLCANIDGNILKEADEAEKQIAREEMRMNPTTWDRVLELGIEDLDELDERRSVNWKKGTERANDDTTDKYGTFTEGKSVLGPTLRAVVDLFDKGFITIAALQETHATPAMEKLVEELLAVEGVGIVFCGGQRGAGTTRARPEIAGVAIVWILAAWDIEKAATRHVHPGRALFVKLQSRIDRSTTLHLLNIYMDPPPGATTKSIDEAKSKLHATWKAVTNAVPALIIDHGHLIIAGDMNAETKMGQDKRAKPSPTRRLAEEYYVQLITTTNLADLVGGQHTRRQVAPGGKAKVGQPESTKYVYSSIDNVLTTGNLKGKIKLNTIGPQISTTEKNYHNSIHVSIALYVDKATKEQPTKRPFQLANIKEGKPAKAGGGDDVDAKATGWHAFDGLLLDVLAAMEREDEERAARNESVRSPKEKISTLITTIYDTIIPDLEKRFAVKGKDGKPAKVILPDMDPSMYLKEEKQQPTTQFQLMYVYGAKIRSLHTRARELKDTDPTAIIDEDSFALQNLIPSKIDKRERMIGGAPPSIWAIYRTHEYETHILEANGGGADATATLNKNTAAKLLIAIECHLNETDGIITTHIEQMTSQSMLQKLDDKVVKGDTMSFLKVACDALKKHFKKGPGDMKMQAILTNVDESTGKAITEEEAAGDDFEEGFIDVWNTALKEKIICEAALRKLIEETGVRRRARTPTGDKDFLTEDITVGQLGRAIAKVKLIKSSGLSKFSTWPLKYTGLESRRRLAQLLLNVAQWADYPEWWYKLSGTLIAKPMKEDYRFRNSWRCVIVRDQWCALLEHMFTPEYSRCLHATKGPTNGGWAANHATPSVVLFIRGMIHYAVRNGTGITITFGDITDCFTQASFRAQEIAEEEHGVEPTVTYAQQNILEHSTIIIGHAQGTSTLKLDRSVGQGSVQSCARIQFELAVMEEFNQKFNPGFLFPGPPGFAIAVTINGQADDVSGGNADDDVCEAVVTAMFLSAKVHELTVGTGKGKTETMAGEIIAGKLTPTKTDRITLPSADGKGRRIVLATEVYTYMGNTMTMSTTAPTIGTQCINNTALLLTKFASFYGITLANWGTCIRVASIGCSEFKNRANDIDEKYHQTISRNNRIKTQQLGFTHHLTPKIIYTAPQAAGGLGFEDPEGTFMAGPTEMVLRTQTLVYG